MRPALEIGMVPPMPREPPARERITRPPIFGWWRNATGFVDIEWSDMGFAPWVATDHQWPIVNGLSHFTQLWRWRNSLGRKEYAAGSWMYVWPVSSLFLIGVVILWIACNQHMRINENHSRSINWSELLSAFLSQLKTTTLMIILSRIKRKESLSYLRFANPWLQNYSGCNCQKLSFFFSFPTFCSRSGHYLLPLTKSSKVNDFDILWLHISELMVGECAFFWKKNCRGQP